MAVPCPYSKTGIGIDPDLGRSGAAPVKQGLLSIRIKGSAVPRHYK